MKKKLGELLIRQGALTPTQLEQALAIQREEKSLLGDILLRLGFVRQTDLALALAEQHGVPYVTLEDQDVDAQVVLLLPEAFCRSHLLVPFRIAGDRLQVAMMAPDDLWSLSESQLLTGYEIEPMVGSPSAILRLLDRSFDRKLATHQTIVDMRLDELRKGGHAKKNALLAAETADSADVPVVRLVNSILTGGIAGGASDIHFEPQRPEEYRVRYRIDGVLYDNMTIPDHIEGALVSRLKVMADLDITERRHPQDGHISFVSDRRSFNLRVSTMPTVNGEKVVIRILEKDIEKFRLEKLGLTPEQMGIIRRFVSLPYGMILVTGPTGSGKSTSLYAMLDHLNRPETNIITLEDPVENQMPGMNQIGVDTNFGMTFASGLKYILRQDPNIVMVGEIRDGETATIAIQASLTGHLMLSTLHTNDAPGAVTRLVELGVQPFLVSSSLIGVVAQRLLRRICSNCRQPWTPESDVLADFGSYVGRLANGTFFQGRGCDQCFGTGYRGRCGVFEVMPLSPALGKLVERRASAGEIKQQAVLEGMQTLMDAEIGRALAGETTLDEVRKRVLVWEQTDEASQQAAEGSTQAAVGSRQ